MTHKSSGWADRSIQDYLSLGYLYLLVLGIVSDSIYYGLLGINILSYSTVLDVLISPITQLTSRFILPLLIISVPGISYLTLKFIQRQEQKKPDSTSAVLTLEGFRRSFFMFSMFIIFSSYIGLGLGRGGKIKQLIESGDIKNSHALTFYDKEELDVKVLGQNSLYLFYVEAGSKTISISPIQGTIKRLEVLEK